MPPQVGQDGQGGFAGSEPLFAPSHVLILSQARQLRIKENNWCQFCFQRKTELTSRQESSGKEDSWKLETFQMEPCG